MSGKKSKSKAAWQVICGRETAAYFTSPVAYFVCGIFLLANGIFFFSAFFLNNRAELRQFFAFLPAFLSIFVPALTMRVFSEERRVGSLETLLTLPVTSLDVTAGKFLASLVSVLVMLAPTLSYALVCAMFGTVDAGPMIGGYFGAVLLAAAFTSVGVFASSVTKNQIIAFLAGASICIFLAGVGLFDVFMPGAIVSLVKFISATSHFESISRGIIDTRDVLYFVSLTAVFFVLTVRVVNNSKKG